MKTCSSSSILLTFLVLFSNNFNFQSTYYYVTAAGRNDMCCFDGDKDQQSNCQKSVNSVNDFDNCVG